MSPKRKLLIITGPTCTGKTALSVEIARRTGAVIISADSRQVYRYMDIGTDKISEEIRREVRHYMIDVVEPDEDYNVYDYQQDVYELLEGLPDELPVMVVGGTGFYIRAVLRGYRLPPRDLNLRRELEDLYERRGFDELLKLLEDRDPIAALQVERERNPRRLLRFLEVVLSTGRAISSYWKERDERAQRIQPIMIALSKPRDELYRDIEARVEDQLRRGLIGEVEWLVSRYGWEQKAFQTLGYQEIIRALRGEVSLMEAINEIKRNTKRFAKRQFTWFRREPIERWFIVDKPIRVVADELLVYLKGRWP